MGSPSGNRAVAHRRSRATNTSEPSATKSARMMQIGITPRTKKGWADMAARFGRSLTPPAAAVVARVTGQPLELVRPLMESLESEVLPRDAEEPRRLYGIRPLGFDRAVERALREWESVEPLGAR